MKRTMDPSEVEIATGHASLLGALELPAAAQGVVLFAHGSGSGRNSPRNRFVAQRLVEYGLGTLLMDLLTEEEEEYDAHTGYLRFNIPFLAERLLAATDWLGANPETADLPLGYFGSSTGAGAALLAATRRPRRIHAVVSRGGRADLAGGALGAVLAPTLLIVGGLDEQVLTLNQQAMVRLGAKTKQLAILEGAGHLFEEPGKLEEVAARSTQWFREHLAGDPES